MASSTSPTEPGFPLSRKDKRPWWAAALLGGFGAGAALAAALGLSSMQAHGSEPAAPEQRAASLVSTAKSDNDRLNRIESKLDEALQRIAHIEGRMDRGSGR